MEKTILVTGKDTYLGNEIARFFLDQGSRVGASVTPRQHEAALSLDQDERLLTIPWYRNSAVSAKNLVWQTANKLGPLNEVWVVLTLEKEGIFLESAPAILEEALDTGLKGLTFLTRELLSLQANNPALQIIFVLFEEDRTELPPPLALIYQGAKGFITSVLAAARRKNLPIWAYESALPQAEAYTQFLLAHPRGEAKVAPPGRWTVFEEKKTLLASLFPKRNDT
ncbi:MAG: hypothetical protein HKM05_09625 [Spirochaetales bacterium]|nr:hypothetical protein [Spirochaetales bacterium]